MAEIYVNPDQGGQFLDEYLGQETNTTSLRPLTCWDRVFESHQGHGCLSGVSVVCCQLEVSKTSWSLVQRSPTDCGASLCVIQKSHEWGGPGLLGGCRVKDKPKTNTTNTNAIFVYKFGTIEFVNESQPLCYGWDRASSVSDQTSRFSQW